MGTRFRLVCGLAAVVPLVLLAACSSSSSSTSSTASSAPASSGGKTSVTETGSIFLLPLISSWQVAYSSANPNILITTSGTNSGTGIADAAAGTVNIGGSDAYLSSADVAQIAGLENIPLAVSAAMVNYNLPGIKKPLNLNGTVVAKIYRGKITTWNDPAIAALNKGVTLPSTRIVTLHRADSSGTTFIFTSYLNAQDPKGWPTSDVGTTVNWPLTPGATAETGSGGMVKGCAAIKGCIAYIGVSYLTQTTAAGLGAAHLANRSGQFVAPKTSTMATALNGFASSTPATGTQSLINGSSGYPIINYEYAIVKTTQPSPAEATAVKNFLTWGITSGSSSKFMAPMNFVPLPTSVQAISKNLIAKIS